jgi:S1-C subfamily serine protease
MRTSLAVIFLAQYSLLCTALNASKNDAVAITSQPAGARIEINGKFIGTTPFSWKIGNWALNPHKSWATSKHLTEPLVMTVIKEGFVPKTIQLTGSPLRWTSLNGQNAFIYYVIQSAEYHLLLDKIGEFLGSNPFNALGPVPPVGSAPEPNLEVMLNRTMPAVVTLSTSTGSGSGFFVTKTGVIVTNKHVVGTASQIRVLTASGTLYETSSIYTDPDHDLALVRVECRECPSLTLADPTSINVGQDVVAIGSPGLAGVTLRNTVTRGIVSAFRGPGETGHVYVQTDAQINPGNSGGPLLNKWGYVVGVNTVKIVGEGYSGLNFAISSNDVFAMLKRRFEHDAPRGIPPVVVNAQVTHDTGERVQQLTGRALTNADIIKLKEAGVSDPLMLTKIKTSPADYHLDTEDLISLKKADLSEAVIAAMLEAQQRGK